MMYKYVVVFVSIFIMTTKSIEIQRPDASTWKRTKCGAPGSPAVPAGEYETNVDYPGNDLGNSIPNSHSHLFNTQAIMHTYVTREPHTLT